jgi:hypothetical protein
MKHKPCPKTGFCKYIGMGLNKCTIDGIQCDKYETFRLENVQQGLQVNRK